VWQLLLDFRDIPITEYEPKKIKMAITGNGNASKEQVAKCCSNCGTEELPKTSIVQMDGSCGLSFSGKVVGNQKLYWLGRFCKQNEERVKKCSVFSFFMISKTSCRLLSIQLKKISEISRFISL
jgi:hypothetical protein